MIHKNYRLIDMYFRIKTNKGTHKTDDASLDLKKSDICLTYRGHNIHVKRIPLNIKNSNQYHVKK